MDEDDGSGKDSAGRKGECAQRVARAGQCKLRRTKASSLEGSGAVGVAHALCMWG